MHERPGSADGVVDSAGDGGEPERPVAGGRALGSNEDVGTHAPVVEPEPAAGPAEPGHHLVRDQQDPVRPADLGDRRPVALRRLNGRERRSHDRLGDEGGNRVRSRGRDHLIELRGEILGRAERVRTRESGAIRVRGRNMPEPPEPPFVGAAQRLAPRQVERAEAVAVVAPPSGGHDPAVTVAVREVVGACQFQGSLDGLGAARDRVDRRFVDRQVRADLRRVRLNRFGGEGAAMGVRQASGLVGHHAGDLRTAVPDVHNDRPAGRIEVLAPGGVADRRPVGLDGDGRVGQGRTAENGAGAHGLIVPEGTGRHGLRAENRPPCRCKFPASIWPGPDVT